LLGMMVGQAPILTNQKRREDAIPGGNNNQKCMPSYLWFDGSLMFQSFRLLLVQREINIQDQDKQEISIYRTISVKIHKCKSTIM
jgi:hypothetical protein